MAAISSATIFNGLILGWSVAWPPGPINATRVGRVARIVRASVLSSPLRPFMPTGRGGKIERRALAFGRVFDILVCLGRYSTWSRYSA